jgi:hypothetical protein
MLRREMLRGRLRDVISDIYYLGFSDRAMGRISGSALGRDTCPNTLSSK